MHDETGFRDGLVVLAPLLAESATTLGFEAGLVAPVRVERGLACFVNAVLESAVEGSEVFVVAVPEMCWQLCEPTVDVWTPNEM